MILLDTNIVSELMRATPSSDVKAWLADQPAASLFLSAVTVTESELRVGHPRHDLHSALEAMEAVG